MRVLFDYNGADTARFGGVALYTYKMMCGLSQFCEPIHGFSHTINTDIKKLKDIKSLPDWLLPACNPMERKVDIGKFIYGLSWRYCRMRNREYLQKILNNGKDYDVWHVTWDVEDWCVPHLLDKPFVYTVHDCTPELFSTLQTEFPKKKFLIEHAARIIAVSENTKKDCMKLYDVSADKIDVIYHAPSLPKPKSDEVKDGVLAGEYILFVGNRRGYKNFQWFVKAISPMLRQRKNVKLICTGSSFSKNEEILLRSLGIRSQVVSIFVEREQFHSLYRNATVFVYPSLYEGFGMPILDAFEAGCPVILSEASCFPEVGGDAADYFTSGDAEGLVDMIVSYLDNSFYRQKMIARGYERVKFFSWDKAVSETYASYGKALTMV